MRQLSEIKAEIEAAKVRARSLKTRKAQAKAWDHVRDLKREALDILYENLKKYPPRTVEGVITYFSDLSGDVFITTELGQVYTYSCNDVESRSWFPETSCIKYVEGQKVLVDVSFDVDHDRLCLVWKSGKITGGTVDEARYTELCTDGNKYAFFKYPEGMTGLFSNK